MRYRVGRATKLREGFCQMVDEPKSRIRIISIEGADASRAGRFYRGRSASTSPSRFQASRIRHGLLARWLGVAISAGKHGVRGRRDGWKTQAVPGERISS